MKSQLSLLLLLLTSTIASAQIPVGSWYTGGSITYNYSTSSIYDYKSNEFDLFPQTYYQLNNNWAVGGGLSFDLFTSKSETTNYKNTNTSYGIRPGVRYYGNITRTVNCYLQGNISYSGGTSKTDNDGDVTKYHDSGFGVSVVPGISWNMKKRTYLDITYGNLGYSHSTRKQEDSDTKNTSGSFNLSLNPSSLSLGLYYVFGKTAE